jgi:molybdopterin/thiamine biosynthesis adenylyltransferase
MDITSRFREAIWLPKLQEKNIVIIGAGGIGSWTALLLSRCQPKSISIFDDDTVSLTNIGGQFFRPSNVNEAKATGLAKNINDFSSYLLLPNESKLDENKLNYLKNNVFDADTIVILAVDNLATRKMVVEMLTNTEFLDDHIPVIDGRMDVEQYNIYNLFTREDKEYYLANVQLDDAALPEPNCANKATSFLGASIASDIVQQVVNYCFNQQIEHNVRPLPFKIEYNGFTNSREITQKTDTIGADSVPETPTEI